MTEKEELFLRHEENQILMAIEQWTGWCATDINKLKTIPFIGDPMRKVSALDCLATLKKQVNDIVMFSRELREES